MGHDSMLSYNIVSTGTSKRPRFDTSDDQSYDVFIMKCGKLKIHCFFFIIHFTKNNFVYILLKLERL